MVTPDTPDVIADDRDRTIPDHDRGAADARAVHSRSADAGGRQAPRTSGRAHPVHTAAVRDADARSVVRHPVAAARSGGVVRPARAGVPAVAGGTPWAGPRTGGTPGVGFRRVPGEPGLPHTSRTAASR